ncbi:MAG TPA: tetratricopeptide repeat protein [Planctomycetota bacterium]
MSAKLRWGPPLLIAAAVFASFWPALSGEWLNWDDQANFLENPHFRGLGAANLAWMFSNTMGHYMPLTWVSLGLDYEIWGMNSAGYHFSNVLIHALNTYLFFRLILAFFRARRGALPAGAWEVGAALAGALVYGLHPLRVESVAWVTERRDLMAGLFFIPSVTAYLRAVSLPEGDVGRPRAFWLSVALFAMSLLSKSIGMMLPAALLALDAVLGRFAKGEDGRIPWGRRLLEKWPYGVLLAGAVVITGISTREAGSFIPTRYDAAQILTQPPHKLAFYAAKTVAPVGLSPFYTYRAPESLFESRFVLAALLVIGLSAALVFWRRRAPGALAAWAGFALLLAPVISPVQAGGHFAADRYTYLAGLVPGLLVAGVLAGVATASARGRALAGSLALLAGVTLGAFSHRYCQVWTDSDRLWTRVIELEPGHGNAFNSRGFHRMTRGRLAEAVADLETAARLLPGNARPLANLSQTRFLMGDLNGAMEAADQAILRDPTFSRGYFTRGMALERRGKLAEAETDYTRAVTLDRVFLDAYMKRALIRGRTGRVKEAVEDFTLVLLMNPEHMRAYLNRAVARGETGDLDGALADYAAALKIDPSIPEAWGGRGMCLSLRGLWAEAAESFERALAVAPAAWPHRADTELRLREARARLQGR